MHQLGRIYNLILNLSMLNYYTLLQLSFLVYPSAMFCNSHYKDFIHLVLGIFYKYPVFWYYKQKNLKKFGVDIVGLVATWDILVPTIKSHLHFWFSFLNCAKKTAINNPCTWVLDTHMWHQMAFLVPGFGLVQLWLLWASGELIHREKILSFLSLSLNLPFR